MRRLVSIAVLLAACAGAVVLVGAKDGPSETREYRIVFDNAFGLVEGGDFRVGGVRAGRTTAFDVTKGDPPKAVVTATITEPGFDDFREDATCTIKPQSLIGEYYVDCQPGSAPEKLPTGGSGTVPVRSKRYGDQTESTVPQDLVNDILRRPYRERLRLIVSDLGAGLAGRPKDLQQVLRRAHPGLRETSKVLRILGGQNRVIEDFIRDADTVVAELERNKEDVARWVVEAGDAAEISASRREALRRTFRKLPVFLGELRPTMARLGELADAQVPLLRDAQRAAPDLRRFVELLGPFAKASRPALRSLGDASEVGRRAFREGAQEVEELRQLARNAPQTGEAPNEQGFARPLRQFLQTMDDRRRAVDDDPRARVAGPPQSDRSYGGGRGGFTGSETIWNYLFWQSLTINGFDDVSHSLRAGATATPCAPFFNERYSAETKDHFDDCNQWLGPSQPGVNGPDPTESGGAAARLARRSGKPARHLAERRGPGEPEAGPVPGQRDASKPRASLPPAVQELLDQLPRVPGAKDKNDVLPPPVGRRGPGDPSTQLLDFLLAP